MVNVSALRDKFSSFQCHGIVDLIDYLDSPEGKNVGVIGSSTIGFDKILNEIWLSREAQMRPAWVRCKSFHLGRNDGSITPLESLEKIAEVFDCVSIPARKNFDEFCGGIARMVQLKPSGPVEIYSKGDLFIVPARHYRRNMTPEELAPFRVDSKMLDPL